MKKKKQSVMASSLKIESTSILVFIVFFIMLFIVFFVRYKRSLSLILSAGNAISKRLEGPKFKILDPLGGGSKIGGPRGGGGGACSAPSRPPS